MKKFEITEISNYLKESVDWLVEVDEGCCQYELDNNLLLVVGWSGGYDKEEDNYIPSKSAPECRINAGIKVSNGYMITDYDLDFNFPYYEDGDIYICDSVIKKNEDYNELAKYFINEYEFLSKLNIDEDGLIIEEEEEEVE